MDPRRVIGCMRYGVESIKRVFRNPFLVRNEINRIARGGAVAVSSRQRIGTNVFNEDWDLLVVLDTCRVDSLKSVSEEYSFLDSYWNSIICGWFYS
jgi:hypothetical protein